MGHPKSQASLFFNGGKTVAHLGYHYHATKDGNGVEQTIPKKHGMNLENTRHQNTRHHVT